MIDYITSKKEQRISKCDFFGLIVTFPHLHDSTAVTFHPPLMNPLKKGPPIEDPSINIH
jgi:hypothetical protein